MATDLVSRCEDADWSERILCNGQRTLRMARERERCFGYCSWMYSEQGADQKGPGNTKMQMKTPRKKAEELIEEMQLHSDCQDGAWMDTDLAKQCAIIAVELLISNGPTYPIYKTQIANISGEWFDIVGKWAYLDPKKYWKQVKIELEKL